LFGCPAAPEPKYPAITLCTLIPSNWLNVGVADNGGPARPRVIDDPAAERGRGLLLVRALAVRTGVSGAGQGRLVWADVSRDAGPHQLAAGADGPVR
jgi:hypothetical protein